MSRAGRKTKRKRQAIAKRQPSTSFVDILKRRLTSPAVSRPWNEDDERRYQKQFNKASPLSHQLSRQII
ncbi:hypothetical protein [Mycolicibacterium komossense]|uniref:Uncharacterized protein n=1 Tax=Mycolicibacterium komossense TaxID=1779 RepID=A0ABT3C4Q2_9MYCO|nr:hypothetical protein [Mycolicibacterium komossense]MCV7224452.1 hypothetical protein [Mycolicibacterium komossense]